MKAEIYRRSDELWDWRLVAGNGEIVATSGGQGFTERNDAREAWIRVQLACIRSQNLDDEIVVEEVD